MVRGSPHLLSGLVDKLKIEEQIFHLHDGRVIMIRSKLTAGTILEVSRSAIQAG
jgi:hypothetical protein